MSTATLDISEARRQFSSLPRLLKDEQVIWVTRHNKKAFAVVDMELMEAVLETLEILRDPNALKMLQDSIEDIRAGRLIDHDDIEKELSDEIPRDDSMDRHGQRIARRSAKKRGARHLSQGRGASRL